MQISASIQSSLNKNDVVVTTNNTSQNLSLPPKATGFGSSVNGGELLTLALAVCYCNDLYREAKKRNISITKVDVEVTSDFGAEGEPGSNFRYTTRVTSDAPATEIEALIAHTDTVAEIHNTLRKGVDVVLSHQQTP